MLLSRYILAILFLGLAFASVAHSATDDKSFEDLIISAEQELDDADRIRQNRPITKLEQRIQKSLVESESATSAETESEASTSTESESEVSTSTESEASASTESETSAESSTEASTESKSETSSETESQSEENLAQSPFDNNIHSGNGLNSLPYTNGQFKSYKETQALKNQQGQRTALNNGQYVLDFECADPNYQTPQTFGSAHQFLGDFRTKMVTCRNDAAPSNNIYHTYINHDVTVPDNPNVLWIDPNIRVPNCFDLDPTSQLFYQIGCFPFRTKSESIRYFKQQIMLRLPLETQSMAELQSSCISSVQANAQSTTNNFAVGSEHFLRVRSHVSNQLLRFLSSRFSENFDTPILTALEGLSRETTFVRVKKQIPVIADNPKFKDTPFVCYVQKYEDIVWEFIRTQVQVRSSQLMLLFARYNLANNVKSAFVCLPTLWGRVSHIGKSLTDNHKTLFPSQCGLEKQIYIRPACSRLAVAQMLDWNRYDNPLDPQDASRLWLEYGNPWKAATSNVWGSSNTVFGAGAGTANGATITNNQVGGAFGNSWVAPGSVTTTTRVGNGFTTTSTSSIGGNQPYSQQYVPPTGNLNSMMGAVPGTFNPATGSFNNPTIINQGVNFANGVPGINGQFNQFAGQQFNGQQFNGQQFNGQQFNGQQFNGQQFNGQQQFANNNNLMNQQMYTTPLGGAIGGQTIGGQSFQQSPFTAMQQANGQPIQQSYLNQFGQPVVNNLSPISTSNALNNLGAVQQFGGQSYVQPGMSGAVLAANGIGNAGIYTAAQAAATNVQAFVNNPNAGMLNQAIVANPGLLNPAAAQAAAMNPALAAQNAAFAGAAAAAAAQGAINLQAYQNGAASAGGLPVSGGQYWGGNNAAISQASYQNGMFAQGAGANWNGVNYYGTFDKNSNYPVAQSVFQCDSQVFQNNDVERTLGFRSYKYTQCVNMFAELVRTRIVNAAGLAVCKGQ